MQETSTNTTGCRWRERPTVNQVPEKEHSSRNKIDPYTDSEVKGHVLPCVQRCSPGVHAVLQLGPYVRPTCLQHQTRAVSETPVGSVCADPFIATDKVTELALPKHGQRQAQYIAI